jgi:hypothetical protein
MTPLEASGKDTQHKYLQRELQRKTSDCINKGIFRHVLPMEPSSGLHALQPRVNPFAGQIGANQSNVLDPDQQDNSAILEKTPDAAPLLSLQSILSLRPFSDLNLWRSALAEFFGQLESDLYGCAITADTLSV